MHVLLRKTLTAVIFLCLPFIIWFAVIDPLNDPTFTLNASAMVGLRNQAIDNEDHEGHTNNAHNSSTATVDIFSFQIMLPNICLRNSTVKLYSAQIFVDTHGNRAPPIFS
jgi:hypothetical protein